MIFWTGVDNERRPICRHGYKSCDQVPFFGRTTVGFVFVSNGAIFEPLSFLRRYRNHGEIRGTDARPIHCTIQSQSIRTTAVSVYLRGDVSLELIRNVSHALGSN